MELLEYYHRTGKCPDWAYNQLNGKSAQENYIAILAKRDKWIQERMEEKRLGSLVEKTVEESLGKAVEDALADLFAGFGK